MIYYNNRKHIIVTIKILAVQCPSHVNNLQVEKLQIIVFKLTCLVSGQALSQNMAILISIST